MTPIVVATMAFALVGGVTFLIGALLLRVVPAIRRDRLEIPTAPGAAEVSILRWSEAAPDPLRRLLERLGRWITPSNTVQMGWYRRRVVRAGFDNPRAVSFFLGAKVGVGLLVGSAYLFYGAAIHRALPNFMPISVLLFGVGFLLPDLWLQLRTRNRTKDIANSFPDVLDLLTVCVEAGLGFDAAVARITDQPEVQKSPLHQELRRMHFEVRAGRPREEALRLLADRVGTEDVRSVVGALIQSERLGTPMGKSLRIQADASRVKRRHRAETKAQLAPLMMLLPTIVFLLPSFILVAAAPSLIRMHQILTTTGGLQ